MTRDNTIVLSDEERELVEQVKKHAMAMKVSLTVSSSGAHFVETYSLLVRQAQLPRWLLRTKNLNWLF